MTTAVTRPGPNGRVARPSLGDQLDRLDGILNGLSDALNESVTAAVTAAVGSAVREAVEAATRELVARSAPEASVITDSGVSVGGRTRRSLRSRARTVVRRLLASVGRETGRLFRRFGDRVVPLVHRMLLAPGRLAALVLADVIAGAVAGVCGPLAGAALGGLAAFAAVVVATPGG
jgi:hypothetical protein